MRKRERATRGHGGAAPGGCTASAPRDSGLDLSLRKMVKLLKGESGRDLTGQGRCDAPARKRWGGAMVGITSSHSWGRRGAMPVFIESHDKYHSSCVVLLPHIEC